VLHLRRVDGNHGEAVLPGFGAVLDEVFIEPYGLRKWNEHPGDGGREMGHMIFLV
jgi:hypothetical protein